MNLPPAQIQHLPINKLLSLLWNFKNMAALKSLLHTSKALLLLPLLFLCGCGSYHLGNPGLANLSFKTLYIKPVINKTFVPQAQALLSEQLIRFFQQSGIDVTQSEESADATLIVVMDKYFYRIFSSKSTDTTLASSFVVVLQANCSLIDNKSCCPLFENTKIASTFNAEANDSVQRVLYQDMPILTQKLANQIRNLVTGTW